MTRTLIYLGTAVIVLVGLKGLVLLIQPYMAFFPLRGVQATPEQRGVAYTELAVQTADRETVYAWVLAHPSPIAEVVFWHGNGGNLSVWLDVIVATHLQDLTVVALDYRGYGKSTGSPSEQGLYRDSDALVEHFWTKIHRPGAKVIYWGRSLGGPIAAYASGIRPPDGLVLESSFPDVASLVARDPVLWLLSRFSSYRFPTVQHLQAYRGAVLVMHGDRDEVIPYRHGRELFQRIASNKRFYTIPGGRHNDLHPPDEETYWQAVRQFIEDAPAP